MSTPNVGHLQIKYKGTWGAFCTAYYDLTYRSAEVICRQLHQGPPLKDSFLSKKCPRSIQGVKKTWLAQINCQGFEASLDQCNLKVLGGVENTACGACKLCVVCLNCQPLHANITGICKASFITSVSKASFIFSNFVVIVKGKSNRRIRLTCLHPCCHPVQIT